MVEERIGSPNDADVPAGKSGGRRAAIIRFGLYALVLLLLLLALVWYLNYRNVGRYMQSTDNAFVQADSVTASPRISGYVDAVLVRDNQDVAMGQPLVRIDARDYRSKTQAGQAQIAVAQAGVEAAIAQVAEQRGTIDRARVDLMAARADARFARDQVARYAPLARTGAEAPERLAQLRAQAVQADAKTAQMQVALASAQRRVATLDAQVAQGRAQGDAARASFDSASIDIGATVIRASIAGRIGNQAARVGQYVQAGTRLMSIVPVREIYIVANFKETQLGLMRIGQPVHIVVDALPDAELSGRIASIAPGTGAQFSILPPQNATGNFTKVVQRIPVRIALDAAAATRAMLVPGMSVEATVDTRSGRDAARQAAADGRSDRPRR